MAFHKAFDLKIEKREVRVYLLVGNRVFEILHKQEIADYIHSVYAKNQALLDHGSKQVLLLWNEDEVPMIDWWIWGKKESESAGAAIEVYLFKGIERYESPVVTAEDGLKVLAGEVGF